MGRGRTGWGDTLRWTIVAAVVLVSTGVSASAQEEVTTTTELWRVGGLFGAGPLDYNADMRSLPGIPSCCPGWTDGSGTFYTVGGAFELPLGTDIYFSTRLLFAGFSGTLEVLEEQLVTRDYDTVTATLRHTLELSQPAILFEELIGWRPFDRFRLLAGVRADFMIGGSFHQWEEIAAPEDIRFENDSRVRLDIEGDIPREQRANVAFLGGLRYDLPLQADGSLVLSPEIFYWHGASNLIGARQITMSGLRLGVGVSWVKLATVVGPSPLEPTRE